MPFIILVVWIAVVLVTQLSFKPIPSMHGIMYIYLHLPLKTTIHVGKYASPMDGMGNNPPKKNNESCDFMGMRVDGLI